MKNEISDLKKSLSTLKKINNNTTGYLVRLELIGICTFPFHSTSQYL